MACTTLVVTFAFCFGAGLADINDDHITISPNQECPSGACLTLSQFANNFSSKSYHGSNLTLEFLPGNHTLPSQISFMNLSIVSMFTNFDTSSNFPQPALIFCDSNARFEFLHVQTVQISRLNFAGCTGNKVEKVEEFTLVDSSFVGVEGKNGTALKLNQTSANISRSSFINNKGYTYHSIECYDRLDTLISVTAGGAISMEESQVTIQRSIFERNRGEVGGAIFSKLNSNITIISSNFVENHATLESPNIRFCFRAGGGALYAENVTAISLMDSHFTDNSASAILSGGAICVHGSKSLTFTITHCQLNNNTADEGGAIRVENVTTVTVSRSKFNDNSASYDGGAVYVYDANTVNVTTSDFINNTAADRGGAVYGYYVDKVYITESQFKENRGYRGGALRFNSSVHIRCIIAKSNFSSNIAHEDGGVLYLQNDGDRDIEITESKFINNQAIRNGGILKMGRGNLNIIVSQFELNTAGESGGVLQKEYGNINMTNSFFISNSAKLGGALHTYSSTVTLQDIQFFNNSASIHGGVFYSVQCITTISDGIFENNHVKNNGGTFYIDRGRTSIQYSTFPSNSAGNDVNNKATLSGGVFWCSNGTLNIDNSNFSLNAVSSHREGVIFILQCSTHITNSRFDQNNGSLYTFNSNLTFSGHLTFENSMEPVIEGNGVISQEGGAITSFQSTVIFTRESVVRFSNNRASDGGALLATESTITIYGKTTIANNMANSSGGGISLKQSRLEINGMCQFVNNVAVRGGGIHASSSTIAVFQQGTLQVTNNSAKIGGGIYLEVNPKLYILKNTRERRVSYLITLTGNHANNGGALYVSDDTNSGACSPDIECFIQTLALHQSSFPYLITENILFSKNTASEKGPNLFGGLLDRCIPSPFAEVYLKQRIHYSGATYLGNISNIDIDSISSQPVRICFCNSEHEPDCSYKPPVIRFQKGKAFNVSLVAVDQVNHTVDANITVSLSSSYSGFDEGQQIQSVVRNCTNLTFNVFSPRDVEKLNLSPDGPCGSATLSTSHVTIKFIECTCPVGFEPLSNSQSSTKCECVCDSALSPYITECNITTSSVLRKDTNSWISYINDTDPPKYVIYQNCPFDYCQPQTQSVIINFNLPNGADSQCAYDRTGVLCGACKEDLSLSLASSRCVPCHTYWPAVFVVILLAAAIAGILLVTALLALNMTVSVGLINGFILYANIVSAGSAVFFPSSDPSFPSVFVAWLNLDMGIDVCFIDGLDVYAKTWLQLAFPVYIISLVVIVIVVSEYSPRFAGLIGKKDPISTLATFILLSYAKLFSITITALSSAVLEYPDGHQETVWLPDGNVPYFKGKHIPLAFVALLIIIIGLPYTILLFLWQWIVRAPRWMIFKWTRDTKLNAFIASHHVPHNCKYRYWTGLLLIVRVVLYITSSVTVSANPQTVPLITNTLIGGLIVFKCIRGVRVYKKSFVDLVDTVLYFNLLVFSVFSLYNFKKDIKKQTAVAHISTIITFILFFGAIFYHVILLIKKERPAEDLNEYHLAPVTPANAEVTHSVVEPPKRDDQDPPPTDCEDSDEQEITEDRPIVSLAYIAWQLITDGFTENCETKSL